SRARPGARRAGCASRSSGTGRCARRWSGWSSRSAWASGGGSPAGAPVSPEGCAGRDSSFFPRPARGTPTPFSRAMATRLPVIATRVGGNAELIESGLTGLLVPPADSDALADALGHYSTDRAIARRHAKAARRLAQSRFSLARMVTDYCSLYETALAAAGVRVPPAAEALSTR